MNILGISAGFHDAAATVINEHGDILFAAHSERYSKIKNDPNFSSPLIRELENYNPIGTVAYYERPMAKQLRQLYAGQGIEWNKLSVKKLVHDQIGHAKWWDLKHYKNYNHHLSHAAAGFQTSPFDRATVVVIDAIGEWDTISIWGAEYINGKAKYKKLWGQRYPHSIGLFYSAMTKRVGLKPNEEEYILMGMAAYSENNFSHIFKRDFVLNEWNITFSENMHLGIETDYCSWVDEMSMAKSTQSLTENLIYNVMRRAKDFGWSSNLVYMGGVALNCLANKELGHYFEKIWILPNPGDAGSSLGAASLAFGGPVKWHDPYLGHCIAGPYPVNGILDVLLSDSICGVASGPAEFGPRALGNRSLLADPRGSSIKDRVNTIKQRQKFRPFAPVILEECVHDYFEMPKGFPTSPYMQTVAKCRNPELFPAVVHHDGTSRVQTVSKNCRSGIRELLEKWYVVTDCPMLLNTSLNIRGEPMVNDRIDADRFEKLYNVKVLS